MKNALIYTLDSAYKLPSIEELNNLLSTKPATKCQAQQTQTIGFVEPVDIDGEFVRGAVNYIGLTVAINQRSVPSHTIKEETESRIKELEQKQGHPVNRKTREQIKDEVMINLLPRAFEKRTLYPVRIDLSKGHIVIGSSSRSVAENILSTLRELLGSLPIKPLTFKQGLEHTANWTQSGAPQPFKLDTEIKLKDDEASVTIKGDDLTSEAVMMHLQEGKQVVEIRLQWDNKIAFSIDKDFQIKKIKNSSEYIEKQLENNNELAEDKAALFDADLILFMSTIGELVTDLGNALGGEVEAI